MAITDPIVNPPASPAIFYELQLNEATAQLKSLQQRIRAIALFRLLAGIAILLSVYKLFRTYGSLSWWIVLCILIIVFIFFLRISGDLQQAEAYQSRRKQINERELAGLKGQFESFDGAADLVTPDHPYAFDLDLFGERSLFQRLNRTVTIEGRNLLGKYVGGPELNSQVIQDRQSMLAALQKAPAWNQQFLITGALNEEAPGDRQRIEEWLGMEPVLLPKKAWPSVLIALPALTIGSWLLFMFGPLPAWPAIVLSLVQLGIAGNKSKMVSESHMLISKRAGILKKYYDLMALFGSQPFQEKGLNKLQSDIQDQQQGTGSFDRLIKLIHALDNRLNIIMNVVLNGLLLWDLNCLYRIEKWKQHFKTRFPAWMAISSELDALISLAIFNFNHPDYVSPTIIHKENQPDFTLDIQDGKHPLLFPEPSIPNNLHQPSSLNLFLITGANMAGKSTFLRMVGLNMVLAMAGANVAATAMSLTPVALYTSMRTNDSLFTHTSFFYAELKKLQWIMEKIRSKAPVYIMLDEILKGTNSRDQHLGSAALIKNIIQQKGRGLIATHDIELTSLAEDYPGNIKNIAFEIDMDGDKMLFNYQYKEGVCQNMNASTLMKQMGIT